MTNSDGFGRRARRWLAVLVGLAAVAVALTAAAISGQHAGSDRAAAATATARAPMVKGAAAAAGRAAGDRPGGFWFGTDGLTMPVTGTGPYFAPVFGGSYGGYIGLVGNWARWQGCHGGLVWSAANYRQARVNATRYHKGIGAAVFWFMAGPGVDPHYNGTVAEATTWGRQQAARTLANIGRTAYYPVVFMDVELPGNAPKYTPAPDNGWNSVYTSPCSGVVKRGFIAPAVDRAVLDGFASYLTSHSRYRPGVYSAPSIWGVIFGTGRASLIPKYYEWTYEANTASLAHRPNGWCLAGRAVCAQFFGGQTRASSHALMWQWSGGGGSSNGIGDFDQIDGTRTP